MKFQNLFSANIKTDKVLLVELLLWARHTDAGQALNKHILLDNDKINNTSLSTHGTIYIQSIIKLSQNSGSVLQKVVSYRFGRKTNPLVRGHFTKMWNLRVTTKFGRKFTTNGKLPNVLCLSKLDNTVVDMNNENIKHDFFFLFFLCIKRKRELNEFLDIETFL